MKLIKIGALIVAGIVAISATRTLYKSAVEVADYDESLPEDSKLSTSEIKVKIKEVFSKNAKSSVILTATAGIFTGVLATMGKMCEYEVIVASIIVVAHYTGLVAIPALALKAATSVLVICLAVSIISLTLKMISDPSNMVHHIYGEIAVYVSTLYRGLLVISFTVVALRGLGVNIAVPLLLHLSYALIVFNALLLILSYFRGTKCETEVGQQPLCA